MLDENGFPIYSLKKAMLILGQHGLNSFDDILDFFNCAGHKEFYSHDDVYIWLGYDSIENLFY